MAKRRRSKPAKSGRLNGDPASGEDIVGTLTEEFDEELVFDGTEQSELPESIGRLGVAAQAEFVRVQARLDLHDGAKERLGTVGRYQLEEEIGRGGMGVVYRAGDPSLDRSVAIKLVAARPFANSGRLQRRLLREAKTLARLTHPNVVRIYDFGRHGSEVYLAMEYVDGTTLGRWQQLEAPSPREILAAHVQAARGLAAAHAMDIVHRDYKPDNVLVASDGRILVGDFGLAGVAGPGRGPARDDAEVGPGRSHDDLHHAVVTKTGALLGTIPYMAPEQLRGQGATPRSDQFAFCVSLWEALVGHRPFASRERDALAAEIERGQPRGAERLPRRLRRQLVRGLASEPEARHADLEELADALLSRGTSALMGLGGMLVFSAGIATAVLVQSPSVEEPECALEVAADEVRRMPQRSALRDRFVDGVVDTPIEAAVARFETVVVRVGKQATRLCYEPMSDGTNSERQALEVWIGEIRAFLERAEGLEPSRIFRTIAELENALISAPPPRALDPQVAGLLQQSRILKRANKLKAARWVAHAVVAVAEDANVELAVAHRHRGWYSTLDGEHDVAMEAYRASGRYADAAANDDARLEALLHSAKTAVMRQGDLRRGRELLDDALPLFERLHEPWGSVRRADYHELHASVLKRTGAHDVAVGHQWLAVLMRGLRSDVLKIGTGYLNLGTAYEARFSSEHARASDLERARECYERAVEVLNPTRPNPGWYEAAFNLGRWLATHSPAEDAARAERLLQVVSRKSEDLRISALTELVLLSIDDVGDPSTSTSERVERLRSALTSRPPPAPIKRIEAWSTVAVALAAMGTRTGIEAAINEVRRDADALGDAERAKQLEKTVASLLERAEARRAASPTSETPRPAGVDSDTADPD